MIQELLADGVRLEDEVKINPLFGHSRKISLRYTSMEISSNESYNPPIIDGNKWLFPSISKEKINIELGLDKDLERYCLKSSSFFKISGQWVNKAYIRRGDCLQLFGNRIHFLSTQKTNSIEEPLFKLGKKLNVLIEGETGTGKSSLAKKIHEDSGVAGDFVHLNLAAYSQGLIESELFGHIKGAFTGAYQDKIGAIERAKNGTLFLDEVDSLSTEVQTKLLTYLDEGEFRRVGSSGLCKVRPRFIFASGKPLDALVKCEQMRKDFFYRLSSGARIKLKPLREQKEKLESFLWEFQNENQVKITKKLLELYLRLPWYGNYRQLIGHLEKKKELILSNVWEFDWIDEELLQSPISLLERIGPKLEQLEYDYVEKTYQRLNGDERSACEVLSISKYRLRRILKMVS